MKMLSWPGPSRHGGREARDHDDAMMPWPVLTCRAVAAAVLATRPGGDRT